MQRDLSIDLLRFVGLSLIVLAHVSPPFWLWEIRSFDVPLMVFVSGLAYAGRTSDFTPAFFWHRAKRLLVPVWLFLTLYFLSAFVLREVAGIDFGIRENHVIGSYVLKDGIGYVWIIRVFLMIAFCTPFMLAIDHRIKQGWIWNVLLVLLVAIPGCCYYWKVGTSTGLVCDYVYYLVGYLPFFMFGLRLHKITPARQWGMAILCMCLLVVWNWVHINWIGGGIVVNYYKYPPRAIFIIYGMMMTVLCSKGAIRMKAVKVPDVVWFVSRNTIWIYLYHIPLAQLTGKMDIVWYVRYLMVYAIAVCVVWMQVCAVRRLKRMKSLSLFSYLEG